MTKFLLIGALALSIVGCKTQSTATVMEDAAIVLNAVAGLQGALPLAGISPVLAKQIGDYASAAAAGVGQCAAVLSAGGETTTLVAKCGEDLTAAIKPTLPPGTPQNVVGLVNVIYSELQVVYAAIEAGQESPAAGGPTKASLAPRVMYTPSAKEAKELRALAVRASALASR